jgi:SAM-dependent methyltransferase
MSGPEFLEHHRTRLSTVSSERFATAHESFVQELAGRDSDPTEALDKGQRAAYFAFFSQCQQRYLALKENEANKEIATNATRCGVDGMSNCFAREAYNRVGDLEQLVQIRDCQTIVMVGCGAFPATLLWLRDHFPGARFTGIDLDLNCVERAAQLTKAMGIETMEFKVMDGRHYDFEGVDFVYVANQVVPKKAVLQRIGRSRCVLHVVVREPTRKGELLAEAVRYDLPSDFAIQGQGGGSAAFLSYDLILRRV